MEDAALARGDARVKFRCIRQTETQLTKIKGEEWQPLAKALMVSEHYGAAPVCADGRIAGNGAMVAASGSIVVSKSGRIAGTRYDATQFVRVHAFDRASWKVVFDAADDHEVQPSSDTPLLWHALRVAPLSLGWTKHPRFVLHGHICASSEEAQALHVPCSTTETLFSTPEDLQALADLLAEYPYPQHQIFVRLNHGFFLLADSADEAIHLLHTKLLVGRRANKL